MKLLKKVLKWSGITLLLIIIALILVPIFFKDEIKEMVIEEVNHTLNAELSLGDFDLTFISTFPNMTIELIDTKLRGVNEFKDVTLADIRTVEAQVGFWSVIGGDQIEIDEVHIIEPKFDVRVLEDGLANYDIVKPDSVKTEEEISEPSNFKLSLNEYSIQNGQILYSDKSADMNAEIINLNHSGKGDLSADVIDFETETTMDELSYEMGGLSYLSKVKTDAVVNLLMESKENSSKFTLKENEIKLNAIAFGFDGYYEMLNEYDNMDIKLDASKATFKEFLSLIPLFYHSGYEEMLTQGQMALGGFVKGKLDKNNMPGWDFNLTVNNASIRYPDLPGQIKNIALKAGSIFPGGTDLDLMTVDVPQFHADLSKNSMDASLSMKNLMSDPYLQSKIVANIDLATLKDFVPMEAGEEYNGILDADVNIKGRMSALERSDFEAFTAEGDLALSDVVYKTPSLPNEVDVDKVKFTFAPQQLTLNELDAKMGESDFKMNGAVENYFGYLLRDETLKGTFVFKSDNLDLDELIHAPQEEVTTEATEETSINEDPVLIPGNIDFALNTAIKNTKYNGIDVKNVRGTVLLKDEIASLNNLTMDAMGGKIGLNGKYNTQDHSKPKMDFGYSLKEIDINQLARTFLTVEKLAPISKYAFGKISSDFEMTTDLTASFEPILSSITSLGDLRSNNINIKGFKNLEKLESVTKLNNISNQSIKNFKTKFKINDGKLSLTPFNVMLGKIGTDVSGYTTLDQQMDYNLKMNVPKDQIPASMIKEVEKAMSKLNALVPKLDIGGLPEYIPVNVKMKGDLKNPAITTDFKESILKATGDFKDNVVSTVTETIKDTVQAVITEQVDNAKAELEKQKQKLLADAQREADKVVAEAKKAADVLRAEGDKQANELVKAAGSNPIQKKIAEQTAKTVRAEADKKAKKVEAEGQKQGDNIMTKARAEADKLGKSL
ncbi:MAG: hypothetical protein MK105_16620 [Crocinitomicaceae bacterium]|nr:hypothetical protein [Crocinitomicaceae bacterium]